MKIKYFLIYGICILCTLPYVVAVITTIWPALYFDSPFFKLPVFFYGLFLQPLIGYYLYKSGHLFIKYYGFLTILNFAFIIFYLILHFD